jgi:hypothetical protein
MTLGNGLDSNRHLGKQLLISRFGRVEVQGYKLEDVALNFHFTN